MNSPVPFIKMILAGDLEACLVFADWLEEQGDKRATLLRRRHARYLKLTDFSIDAVRACAYCQYGRDHDHCVGPIGVVEAYWEAHQKRSLADYVRRKFIRESFGRLTPAV